MAAAPVSARGAINGNCLRWRRHARQHTAACPPTTGSPGSTTRGRRAWSRTSPSTSSGRGRSGGPGASSSGSARAGSRSRSPRDGIEVIGVDLSAGMLEVARERARARGRRARPPPRRLPLPPVEGPVPLVIDPVPLAAPHADRRRPASRRSRPCMRLLEPGGPFVFDVFWPGADDIAETHGRWLEREPGIFERADWDEHRRTLILRVRGDGDASRSSRSPGSRSPSGASCSAARASSSTASTAGSTARPWSDHEDSIWVCRRALRLSGP